jgi:hypothetical protein
VDFIHKFCCQLQHCTWHNGEQSLVLTSAHIKLHCHELILATHVTVVWNYLC